MANVPDDYIVPGQYVCSLMSKAFDTWHSGLRPRIHIWDLLDMFDEQIKLIYILIHVFMATYIVSAIFVNEVKTNGDFRQIHSIYR